MTRTNQIGRALLGVGIGLSVLFGGCAGTEPALTAQQRDLNLKSFDEVWTTVRDRNYDPTLGGIDWAAVKTELRPKVEAAETMGAARGVMEDMIHRLKQSHFAIIPAAAYSDVAKPDKEADDGESGLQLRVVNNQALVVDIAPDSAASEAGVKPGWVLEAVDGEPIRAAIDRMKQAKGEGIQFLTMAAFALERRASGPVGKAVPCTFDVGGKTETRALTMKPPAGIASTLGNLPTMFVTFESRRIPVENGGEAGYLTFSSFLDPARLMPKINEAVESFGACRGIVIDLRGNIGGLGAMAMGITGHFIESQVKLGEMTTRDGTMKFIANPRGTTYAGPVAVLIDECSISTAEILAGGLKDLGRARVFGTRSAGMALPSTVTRLPNGDGFQYAFANYISAGGKALEGDGVTPDVEAGPNRGALLAGQDPALAAALSWIAGSARRE